MAVSNEGLVKTNIFNKKRKRASGNEAEKGAGMIWGANSPSLRKNYQRKESDDNDLSDFGKYMAEKQRKLRIQYDADASDKLTIDLAAVDVNDQSKFSRDIAVGAIQTRTAAKLFVGVAIFVDGFTIPSHQELRTLMIKHGGIFENYFRRDHVTHVICSTLPDSKIKDPRSFSRGLPIVKPSWVVDSIAAGRVLAVSSYCLERLARDDPNQCTLSSFLAAKKGAALDHLHTTDVLGQVEQNLQRDNSGPISDADAPSEECEFLQQRCTETESQAVILPKSGPDLSEDLGSTHDSKDNKTANGSVLSHCSLGDANFVQNFFKNSRLHFIGTWRTRYQKRYSHYKDKDGLQQQSNAEFYPDDPARRTILHVDMDCFFVSVVARNRPELIGKPVAVCHSENSHGSAEISSSNYAARKFGVKSGMLIRQAKALCPSLEIVPYDFAGYQQVADEFYEILHKHCNKVQAISCDEAYLDVTGVTEPSTLASNIRKDIFNQTRCTASVGIAGNILLARMATRKAKPDGQYYLEPEQVEGFLSCLAVDDLPGVGWALQEKLHSQGLYKCAHLLAMSKEALQKALGSRTGEMLWCYARGIDHRQVQSFQERKSIGAEVNWGVRFNSAKDAHHFLSTLCKEVSARLQEAMVCGHTFTLKLKKRKEGAGEPHKFMGCGSCDNFSKSTTLPYATDNNDIILRISSQILNSFSVDAHEIRGMGLQVTKLEQSSVAFVSRDHQQQRGLDSWLHASSKDVSIQEAFKAKDSLHEKEDEEVIKTENWSMDSTDTDGQQQNTSEPLLLAPFKDAFIQGLSKSEGSLYGLKDREMAKADNLACETVHNENVTPWCVDKSRSKEELGTHGLGRVLKGPFSQNKRISYKEKGKQNLTEVQMLPPLSELDRSILPTLPPEILAEINEGYDGALAQYMPETLKSVLPNHEPSTRPRTIVTAGDRTTSDIISPEDCEQARQLRNNQCEQSSSDKSNAAEARTNLNQSIPLSLTQVDMDTLKELPSHVQQEVLKSLPVHRPDDLKSTRRELEVGASSIHAVEEGPVLLGTNLGSSYQSHKFDTSQVANMWFGSPPKWALLFKEWEGTGAGLLQTLSVCYFRCRTPNKLSFILLELLSCLQESHVLKDLSIGCIDSVAFQYCLELFKQYFKLEISNNLEEVSVALRILKRLAGENQLWEEVCNIIIPYVQAIMGENYGGTLSFR